MSLPQIITESIVILIILIMFFGLINLIYEFYYLGKKTSLNPKEIRLRNIFKLLVLIPAFLLFVSIFIALIFLYKFIHDYDITNLIQYKYMELNYRLQRIEQLFNPVISFIYKWTNNIGNEPPKKLSGKLLGKQPENQPKKQPGFWARTKQKWTGIQPEIEPEIEPESLVEPYNDETGLNY